MPRNDLQQFVVMPARGLRAATLGTRETVAFLVANQAGPMRLGVAGAALAGARRLVAAPGRVRVLDSIHEDGAKLIEASEAGLLALRAEQPGLRVVPVVYYQTAEAPRLTVSGRARAAGGRASVAMTIRLLSAKSAAPVKGADVVAFTDFEAREGAMGKTDSAGKVRLALGPSSRRIERLYVYPELGYWGLFRKGITLKNGQTISLNPLDLAYADGVRHFLPPGQVATGQGVKVAVVDTGIGPHPDLHVQGGLNTVHGESSTDFADSGALHGTHVGGIIAARGTPPKGIRGVAPGVTLRSYRVFGRNAKGASNFAIAKAIDAAAADGCDLINMSLGGGPDDQLTSAAIADARAAGVLVLVASGNDDRSPVSFPASDPRSVAVSAVGRKGTFPAHSLGAGDVAAPYGSDPHDFIASFSNIGPEIDVVGPGVDIISTVPGGYASMSGTSMACPAITGMAARIVGAHPAVVGAARDQARSDAMARLLSSAARSLGFALRYEGHGLPR